MSVRFIIPQKNQREVDPNTTINFVIESSNIALETLNVQLNGISVISQGVFQRFEAVFSEDPQSIGIVPTHPTRFLEIPNHQLKVGDTVRFTDTISQIDTTVISINENECEFRHAFPLVELESRLSGYQLELSLLTRGFQGSIGLIGSEYNVSINLLEPLHDSATEFLIVEYKERLGDLIVDGYIATIPQYSDLYRFISVFRTRDTLGPQFRIPSYLQNSQGTFYINDIEQNQIIEQSIQLTINEVPAIVNGYLTPSFFGNIQRDTNQNYKITTKSIIPYQNNQDLTLSISAQDGYGNQSSGTFYLVNKEEIIPEEILEPVIEEVILPNLKAIIKNFSPVDIAPQNTEIRFLIQSEVPNARLLIDTLSVIINENTTAIDNGSFTENYTGTLAFKESSDQHTLICILQQGQLFEEGQEVDLEIRISDTNKTQTSIFKRFTIFSSEQPNVTITPPSGKYNTYQRIQINADQESTIFYTIDGSLPSQTGASTLVGTSPILDVPIFVNGLTRVRAFATNQFGVSGLTVSNLYELNTIRPVVKILSPQTGIVLDRGILNLSYRISIQTGYITKVELLVNQNPRIDLENTLLESEVSVVGLISGLNSIKIIATDNFGNEGIQSIEALVNPTKINSFELEYAPLECPKFTIRPSLNMEGSYDQIDTETVCIIGLGKREQVLVEFGLGEGKDGLSKNFQIGTPSDGRHFQLQSYPIRSATVYLFRKNRLLTLTEDMYKLNKSSGQLVLDHPIEFGESLSVKYLSEVDINAPHFYLSNNLSQIYQRFGNPSPDNTLSLGCKLAFENGAKRIIAVQGETLDIDSFWTASFSAIEKEECYWVCPIIRKSDQLYYPGIILAGLNHCERMSSTKYRKERIIGAYLDKTTENSFAHQRGFFSVINDNPKVTTILDGEVQELDKSILSACIAGKGSSLSPQEPLKYKAFTGIQINSKKRVPRLDADEISNNGLVLIHPLQSGGQIEQGRTGYVGVTNAILEEMSVLRIVDNISKRTRRLVENRFVGKAINKLLISQIKKDVVEFLQKQTSLISFGEVDLIQIDPNDPRQINISIILRPLFPLNGFSIRHSIVTSI